MKRWGPLVILAAAQFVMVLDQAVMNVSISQLVADLDTTVTAIQAVITLYSLVMAMFMVTGGKIGDLIGRRRAFTIGLVVYAVGSAITAVSPNVIVLAIGWSVLEGLGAALVLPALAALIGGNYVDGDRRTAYAVIGGVAGAGIAVGPILGGWATTELSWRVVFVGEVVVVLAILAGMRLLREAPRGGDRPRLDGVGAALSAFGLGLVVLGVLQASTWGWLTPKDSPVEPFGFALTPFVVAAGAVVLWTFVRWQRHRTAAGTDPLVHLELFGIRPLRSGLAALTSQNLILMGIFFTIPLYLQLVLGFDALDTGLRMLPVSIAMFVASMAGSRLSENLSTRTIVRTGFLFVLPAALLLLWTIQPSLSGGWFAVAMTLLGLGMGLIASQLGNVVQSSVDESGRSEAGGLQYTAQQLGSAIGVALIGAIVLSGLTANWISRIDEDPRVPDEVTAQAEVVVSGRVSFVSADELRAGAEAAGADPDVTDALVEDYEQAQLVALKVGLLMSAAIALVALGLTGGLPSRRPDRGGPEPGGPEPGGPEPEARGAAGAPLSASADPAGSTSSN
jgi:EmrB/QacA subfamily drug resistance transporter